MNGLTFVKQLLKKPLFYILFLALSFLLSLLFTRFDIEGDWEGFYLLKANNWRLFEVKDNLFLGEYERVLLHVDFAPLLARLHKKTSHDGTKPYLEYDWNKRKGHGFIESFYPDGTKFIVCFGRFIDSDDKNPSGLFVGGGLPHSSYEHSEVTMNETGMAWFDGKEWQHLWCNVNESIASLMSPDKVISPSSWDFLGSKVLFAHDGELIIKSSHRVIIDRMPFRIDRFAFYRAGDRHFALVIRIRNEGEFAAGYFYVYGDEPWVGDYGTSAGNVGWVRDRPYFFEGTVDPNKYSYAGMWDSGNPYANESAGQFTGLANFLEWQGEVKPNLVYFSNRIGMFAKEKQKVPLSDRSNRVVFAQWGPRILRPGQSELLMLGIGMANNDPKTGFPVKPDVKLDMDDLNFVLNAKD